MLPASLLKNSIFTVSALASLLAAMGMFGSIMFIPLFFQGVLGLTATHSGQFMTPMMLSLLVAAIAGVVWFLRQIPLKQDEFFEKGDKPADEGTAAPAARV